VRAATNREMTADWRVSPWGRKTAMVAVGNTPGTTAILASKASGPSQGRTTEVPVCLSAGEKERSGKGNGTETNGF
jgi:hypothetical protein